MLRCFKWLYFAVVNLVASSHLLTEDLETCYKLHCCFTLRIAFNSLKVEMIVSFYLFSDSHRQISTVSEPSFLRVLCNISTTTPLVSSRHLVQNIVVDHTVYYICLVSGVFITPREMIWCMIYASFLTLI